MNTINENEFSNSKGIKKLETGNYEIGSLLFKTEMLSLFDSNGEEISLDYQQGEILKMFLKADDYFLNKKKTIETLWPDNKDAAKTLAFHNRFNTCITRLRQALSADPNIEVHCKHKKGYELIVKDKTSQKGK